ncbi:MAG: hypothetical protein DRP45_08730, partial [Candidatus Zixiibacteriota bacterium]
MPQRVVQPSFTGGELAPSLHKRSDLAKYSSGLKTCLNFFCHPHGGISNRAGFEFIVETKDSSKASRLIDFQFNADDTYILEFGDQYMRVIRLGAQVELASTPSAWASGTTYAKTDHVSYGGVNYYSKVDSNLGNQPDISPTEWYPLTGLVVEIPTPYLEAELFDIKFTQSADVITLAHKNHPISELSRAGHTLWSLDTITFGANVDAPTGLIATPSGMDDDDLTYYYQVTAVDEDGKESLPSTEASALVDSNWQVGEKVDLSWTAVTGADRYNVYCSRSGLYGYIGTTYGTAFVDTNISPDTSDTPPIAKDPFAFSGDYPGAVGYHQQRLAYASTTNEIEKIIFSRISEFHNLNVSFPQKASDAITMRLNSNEVNEVRHLISMNDLIVMTSGAIWKITSGDNGFSFDNIRAYPQSKSGASNMRPLAVNETVLYTLPKSGVVRDLTYTLEVDGYAGNNLSVMADHMFRGYSMASWAYAQEPDSIVWVVRSDGTMLGLTYLREHQIWGWHRHTTDGYFEDVAVISEGDIDAVYAVVRRTVNGNTVRYIERMHERIDDVVEDAFFVDSGLSYDGAPVTTLAGLDHLEAKSVVALADGNVVRDLTVTSGSITLPYSASKVHVGLEYECDAATLEPPIEGTIGRVKSASRLIVSLLDSRGLWAGPDEDNLVEMKQRYLEAWGDPTELFTGDVEIGIEASWENRGELFLRQKDPLPSTI